MHSSHNQAAGRQNFAAVASLLVLNYRVYPYLSTKAPQNGTKTADMTSGIAITCAARTGRPLYLYEALDFRQRNNIPRQLQ